MKKRTRKKMGRPPLPESQRLSVKVFFRVTPSFHKALLKAAKREGKPLATWVSDTLAGIVEGEH
jgi:predicted HicB family RNase H-like nuclease